ncbi:MAG: tyrosine-type recombinase/integrase [Burkholderiales bacterium]|nr:tyrosine-type recombinase/integrase [Burkholderiales bacterium]
MKHILTASKVESLYKNPKEGKYLDGDNLYLFVSPAGALSFRYRVRTPEKTTWVTIGKYPVVTLAEARAQSLDYARIIAKGISPKDYYERQKSLNLKFSLLADEYIKYKLPLVRTKEDSRHQELRTINNEIVAKLGDIRLTELTTELIHKKLIQPKVHDSPASVKRTLITLKQLLRYAFELGYITTNPIDRINISTIYKDKPVERFLSFNEIYQLLTTIYKSNIRTQWKHAVALLVHLGCRKNELLQAKWEQVLFDDSVFHLHDTKMNKAFRIPLSTQTIHLFNELYKLNGNSEFVFTGANGINAPAYNTLNNILKFTETVLDKPYTIHSLRRTFASLLPTLGFDIIVVEAALNHEFRYGASKHYFHYDYFEERKKLHQVWSDKIESLFNQQTNLTSES